MRAFGRVLIVAFAAACMAACTEVVDEATGSRYAQYNRATDWAKNEAILLNIARASLYQPLNFLIYNAYSGSATVSAAASSPAFVIGPARVASQKQYTFGQGSATASAMAVGSISVQNLDTQDFYESLLASVDYTDLYAFQRQSYSRELLFRLFAEYVSLKPGTGDPQGKFSAIIYNDTSDQRRCFPLLKQTILQLYGSAPKEYQTRVCFEDLVVFALISGLSSEIRTVASPSGGSGQNTAQGGGGAADGTSKTSSKTSNNTSKPQTEGRLCFDSALAVRAYLDFAAKNLLDKIPPASLLQSIQYQPMCGSYWPPDSSSKTAAPAKPAGGATPARAAADGTPVVAGAEHSAPVTPPKAAAPATPLAQGKSSAPGVATLGVHLTHKTGFPIWDIHLLGQHTIEIGTRSTFSIYNFLGSLVRDPQSPANALAGPLDSNNDPYLLTVNFGQPTGCFALAMLDLGLYCVPLDGAANTKQAFSILSQLLALKTTTGDLQLQPIIRLLPP